MKFSAFLSPYEKINSRWIIDPNIKSKIVKILEKKKAQEEQPHALRVGKAFINSS